MTAISCRSNHSHSYVVHFSVSSAYYTSFSPIGIASDFERHRIRVSKQLTHTRHCEYYVEKPKTKSGEQYIPMLNSAVYQAFQRVIQERKNPKVEYIIDGYTGFLFFDKDGKPKVAGHLEHALKRIVDNYNKSHADKLTVSHHVLRHTFCTDMAAGMTGRACGTSWVIPTLTPR